jgi:hypothetical protein
MNKILKRRVFNINKSMLKCQGRRKKIKLRDLQIDHWALMGVLIGKPFSFKNVFTLGTNSS